MSALQSGKSVESLERLSQVASRARPVSLASEQVLELLPVFSSILPNGLQRGSTVVVEGNGASSLALALAAGASQAGSWTAAAGLPALGAGAAVELGICVDRLLMVTDPPREQWPTVAAAMLDAFDVVLAGWPGASASVARRLAVRARERKSVLVSLAPGGSPLKAWQEAADLRFRVASRWEGLGAGHGRLTTRLMSIELSGRRSVRPQRLSLWLPGPNGRLEVDRAGPNNSPFGARSAFAEGAGPNGGGSGDRSAVEQPPLKIAAG